MIHTRSIFFLLLLLLFCSPFLKAQDSHTFLDGKLIDARTREIIPFATIKLKNKTIGVISNADGHFKFSARYRGAGNVVEISCIGYITKSLPLDQLSEGQVNVIELQQATKELAEVTIKAKKLKELAPYRIVQMAIDRIPNNYPQKPYSYAAYYRDYQWKDEGYINLNEALWKFMIAAFSL